MAGDDSARTVRGRSTRKAGATGAQVGREGTAYVLQASGTDYLECSQRLSKGMNYKDPP